MRALFRRVTMVVAAAMAAAALYLGFTLPPRALELDGPMPASVVFGAYHVHSIRSDGTGTVDEIARAASGAGLSFVILTDHGDATRAPDPPTYRHGVLVLDAVEISSDGGHLVALGLDRPSPYPLGGRSVEVTEDVHRQGGWVVMAHPDSARQGLRWGAGQSGQQDAIEWLSADSEWRDHPPARVIGAALRSLLRPAESVVSLFHRPSETLDRWDAMTRTREVVGLAAADAHGGITSGTREAERPALVRVPSYGAMFRTMAQGVELDRPFGGDAEQDAAALLGALRSGRTFTIIHGLARPAVLEFSATSAAGTVTRMGGRLDNTGGPVTMRARVPQAPGIQVELRRLGEAVASGRGSLEYSGPLPDGAYRVEALFPGASVPWLVSNPIYVGPRRQAMSSIPPDAPLPATGPGAETVALGPDAEWTVERDSTSKGAVSADDGGLRFSFELGAGAPSGQYAALVAPVGGEAGFDRVRFIVSANRPMRLSLQLRLPGGRDGLRWRRSVYVGTEPTPVVVRLEELEPVGGISSQQPIVARIQSVLFVVDTVNTLPGTSGTLRFDRVELGVGSTGGQSDEIVR